MLEKLKDIILNYVDVDPADITEKSGLVTDLGLNSLDLVMMAGEIEKETGRHIPEKLYGSVKTVGDIITLLAC